MDYRLRIVRASLGRVALLKIQLPLPVSSVFSGVRFWRGKGKCCIAPVFCVIKDLMQILKSFLLACSIAVATSPVYSRAEDTAAQAAARAALQQKMRELGGQPPAAPPPIAPPPATEIFQTPPPAPQTPRVQPAAPRSVLAPAPRRGSPAEPAFQPAPVRAPAAPMGSANASGGTPAKPSATLLAPEPASADLIEQARQSMRAKLAELQANHPTAPEATPAPQFQTAPHPIVEPAATTTAPVTTEVKSATPSKAEIRAAKEREAAEKKAAEKAAAKPARSKTVAAPTTFTPTPIEPPATNLPAGKEQRLQSLLEQYKTDKITAEEYHAQRAKILAEP